MNLREIISRKRSGFFWAANVITALLCYGFELTNGGITVDDEMINSYLSKSGGLISAGRYGLLLINSVFRLAYLPFFYLALGLVFFILGNHIYTSFFRALSHDKFDETASAVFSVTALSAPVYMYKMIFQMNAMQMGLIYMCAAFTVIFIYRLSTTTIGTNVIKYIIASVILICFCFSNNETTMVDIGIMFLFSLLLGIFGKMSYVNENRISVPEDYVKPMIKAVIVVIAGFLLWKLSVVIIVRAFDLSYSSYTKEYVLYGKEGFADQLSYIFQKTYENYISHPWTFAANLIMVIGFGGFCLIIPARRNKNIFFNILIFLAVIILSFFMPLVTGNPDVLPRTKTYLAVFDGLCMSAGYVFITKSGIPKKSVIKALYFALFSVLIFYRAAETNKISFDIYNMSQYDYNKVYSIYNDVERISDGDSLPVIFVGDSELYRPFEKTMNMVGINSIFSYGRINPPYRMNNAEIYNLFELMGMKLNEGSEDMFSRAYADSQEMDGVYPAEGSIMKTSYAIIVKLGKTSELKSTDYSDITMENAGERIKFASDIFEVSEDKLTARGWAFMDEDINGDKYFLIDNTTDNSSYILNCTANNRADVTEVLNDGKNHDESGFEINDCNISALPSGEYHVRLAIYNNGVYYISDCENTFTK